MSQSKPAEPLDFIRRLLDEQVFIKLRGAREITGRLQAYDAHCNVLLSDVVETIYKIGEGNDLVSSTKKTQDLVMIRGDSVILLTPANED